MNVKYAGYVLLPILAILQITACSGINTATLTPATTDMQPVTQPPLTSLTPHGTLNLSSTTTSLPAGLSIQGYVTTNGMGLANVNIYRSFASYPGVLVATTGKDGYYQVDFMPIPGDEMVAIWAALEGFGFTPKNYFWRHYHGYEEMILDFVGVPVTQTPAASENSSPIP
jgi:hypothetical protein